ncbi:28765_t:CDS:2 [Dentiscutata erythropus]|uniref:28765_t:CDS:1 n=1 Tax=Dentiscutata erythropus TaxID=1348616 RepID=A0A9N9IG31_9GLOM|nr:28765_t:CDS:2 [Dentiscutata erythropus]
MELNLETSIKLFYLQVQDNGTHKGQHLVEMSGLLPYINEQIVFSIDDTFPNWLIAEHYIAQYGRQKGFDLANVVAQLQREHHIEGNDASRLLTQLYEYKEMDPNWYIKPLIDPISNRLREIFWIDPGQ